MKKQPGQRVQLHRALSKLGWGSRTLAWEWIRAGKPHDCRGLCRRRELRDELGHARADRDPRLLIVDDDGDLIVESIERRGKRDAHGDGQRSGRAQRNRRVL